jgi:hypothetical protein
MWATGFFEFINHTSNTQYIVAYGAPTDVFFFLSYGVFAERVKMSTAYRTGIVETHKFPSGASMQEHVSVSAITL